MAAICAAAAGIATALALGPASASTPGTDPVSLDADVRPTVVRYPGTRALEFTLRIAAGPVARRLRMTIAPARYSVAAAEQTRTEGTPLVADGPVRVEGIATLTPVSEVQGTPGCSPTQGAPHGEEPLDRTVDLSIPANGVVTIGARYRVAAQAPWSGSDYRLTYALRDLDGPKGARIVARTPRPRLRGRVGAAISLTSTPRVSPAPGLRRSVVLRRGTRLTIRGRANPLLRRHRVKLRYIAPGGRRLRRIGSPRVDRRGRFSLRGWMPTRRGRYEVWAFTPAAKGVERDYACPLGFTLR